MSDKKKKSGQSHSVSTQSYTPNAQISPYLTDVLGQAQSNYNRFGNVPYFPGSTVSPFSPQSRQAFELTGGLAGDQGLLGDAISQNRATSRGEFLDPRQDPRWQRGLHDITNAAGSIGGGARRMGSGAVDQMMAEGGGSLLAGIYGDERGRMQQAGLLAPQLDQSRYYGAGQLRNVGQAVEAKDTARRLEEQARYETNEGGARAAQWFAPYQNAVYGSPLNQAGTQTGESKKTDYTYTNPYMQYAGLGMSLAGAIPTGGLSLAAVPGQLGGLSGGGGGGGSLGPSSVFGPGGWESFYGLGGGG